MVFVEVQYVSCSNIIKGALQDSFCWTFVEQNYLVANLTIRLHSLQFGVFKDKMFKCKKIQRRRKSDVLNNSIGGVFRYCEWA